MAVDLSSIGVWASGPRPPAFDPQPLVQWLGDHGPSVAP